MNWRTVSFIGSPKAVNLVAGPDWESSQKTGRTVDNAQEHGTTPGQGHGSPVLCRQTTSLDRFKEHLDLSELHGLG